LTNKELLKKYRRNYYKIGNPQKLIKKKNIKIKKMKHVIMHVNLSEEL